MKISINTIRKMVRQELISEHAKKLIDEGKFSAAKKLLEFGGAPVFELRNSLQVVDYLLTLPSKQKVKGRKNIEIPDAELWYMISDVVRQDTDTFIRGFKGYMAGFTILDIEAPDGSLCTIDFIAGSANVR